MKTIVLNLPESTDRLAAFFADYPAGADTCEVFPATGVNGLEIPSWWQGRPAYYANLISNTRICDLVIQHGAPVMVYEDDCGFVDGYVEKLNQFLAEVPSDWTYLNVHPRHTMFGPYAPEQVSANVLRTHACFCAVATVMTPASAAVIKEALLTPGWPCRHVPDNRISMKIFDGSLITYSPLNRLGVHKGGISDSSGVEYPELTFEDYIYKNLDGQFVNRKEELEAAQ